MALRELLAAFDVDTGRATAALKNIDGAISGVTSRLGGIADALLGGAVVHGLTNFVKQQIEVGDALVDTATKLGVSTDELQKFTYGAGLAGVSSEQAGQALGYLNKNIGEALAGSKMQADAFHALGVSLKNNDGKIRALADVLPDLADGFAKMGSQQERTSNAMRIFGRSGAELLPFLQQGRKGVEQLNAEFGDLGGGMRKDFLAAADKTGDALFKLRFGLSGLKTRIAFEALPWVEKFANKGQKWVAALHKMAKETDLAKFAMTAMSIAGAAAFVKMATSVAKLVGLAPKGAGLVRTLLGLGELGVILGIVLLLVLAFQDLWKFMNGGESVIGTLITKFLGIEEANRLVAELWQGWNQVQGSVKALGPPLKELGKFLLEIGVKAMPYVISAFVMAVKVIGSAITLLAGFVEALAKIPEAVKKGDFNVIGNVIDRAGNAVFGKGGFFGAPGRAMQSFTRDAPGAALKQPSAAGRGGGVTIGEQRNQTDVNITVQGAHHPVDTANAVKDRLRDELRRYHSGQHAEAIAALNTEG